MDDKKLMILEEKLKNELSEGKINYINKYKLKLNDKRQWMTTKNNVPERVYFSHNFILKNTILEVIFRKYQLCYAKLKYFRKNLDKFSYFKYDSKLGFIETEFWDIEFFCHKKSGKYIDLRYLQAATILITVPNMIFGFYGMNVKLPLQDKGFFALGIIFVIMVALMVVLWKYLKKKVL